MSKTIKLSEVSDLMTEVLDSGGKVAFVTFGYSMMPLLRNGCDKVILTKPTHAPKKKDVIFYKRDDGNYVLHRIVAVKDGQYTLRGDNQWILEHGITEKHIIAVAVGFERNGKSIKCSDFKYKLYCLALPFIRLRKRLFSKQV